MYFLKLINIFLRSVYFFLIDTKLEKKLVTNEYYKQANQREEEYKNQIKTLTSRLKEVQSFV